MHIQMILRRCHGFSLSNADDSDDNDNGPDPPPRWAVTTTDDSESIEAGTSSTGLDNVREIGEMYEHKFFMLRGIV